MEYERCYTTLIKVEIYVYAEGSAQKIVKFVKEHIGFKSYKIEEVKHIESTK